MQEQMMDAGGGRRDNRGTGRGVRLLVSLAAVNSGAAAGTSLVEPRGSLRAGACLFIASGRETRMSPVVTTARAWELPLPLGNPTERGHAVPNNFGGLQNLKQKGFIDVCLSFVLCRVT